MAEPFPWVELDTPDDQDGEVERIVLAKQMRTIVLVALGVLGLLIVRIITLAPLRL